MSGCTCDIDDKCVCCNDDERLLCDHWHFPAPRIISARARGTFYNELRDQGEERIKRQQAEARDRIADSARKTAAMMRQEGGLTDWQQREHAAAREKARRVQISNERILRPPPSRMDDPSEKIGSGKPIEGGVKMR